MKPPDHISNADWGTRPSKRWRANATLAPDGLYDADGPHRVGTAGSITHRMGIGSHGTALLGFDFPIGIPRGFAALTAIGSFPRQLPLFGHGRWSSFFEVADDAAEVGLLRPFYPRSAGARGQHSRGSQLHALGLGAHELLRRCERPHAGRPGACPLFWTLGAKQAGRGALAGWRELIIPALEDPGIDVALWPFDGALADLVETRGVIVTETYPAEFYRTLGVRFGNRDVSGRSGKRRQHDRRAQADRLLVSADRLRLRLSPALLAAIRDGFGGAGDGEDKFDAVIGLLGILAVVCGVVAEGTPGDDEEVIKIEGWILGRPSSPVVDDPPAGGSSTGPATARMGRASRPSSSRGANPTATPERPLLCPRRRRRETPDLPALPLGTSPQGVPRGCVPYPCQ